MQYRQGDIFFETVGKPNVKVMKPYGNNVLAYGEVTGHSHKICDPPISECESYIDEKGDIYVMSPDSPLTVSHDEHDSITMPQGEWICVTRQREYDPLAEMRERKVAD
jgi:hypothetical protein